MPEQDVAPSRGVEGSPPAVPEEVLLVRRAQLGSTAAFDELVVRRSTALYRYLIVRLRNEPDARDALQETLTAAWQGLPRLREPEKFWPWLVGIAVHKAGDSGRTRRAFGGARESVEHPHGHDALETREAIAALPPHLRDVLVLRYALGFSEQEVAEMLGVRVGTVKSRSARARTALKEALA
jgi:RNA polymerase sigma-70 factor (ECF subfamily)